MSGPELCFLFHGIINTDLHASQIAIIMIQKTSYLLPAVKYIFTILNAKRFVLMLFCLSIVQALSIVYAESGCYAYFYNPESNVDNFASLKSKMDIQLKKSGKFRFQPFIDKDIFEKQFKGNQEALAILSSWHYKMLKEENGIKPVLVGVIDGKTTQKKALTARKEVKSIETLKGASIASAGSDDYTRNLLKQMLGKENEKLVESFQLLAVPKDIDALISVGFGLAEAALTTESSLDMLSAINPRLSDKLTTLAVSDDILLPVVAIPENHSPNLAKLLIALKNMGDTEDGNKGIQILGLDGWRKIDEKDGELLNK